MTTTPLFAALGALFVSVVAGCGGNVTIDPSGTGGSGGEGGGTSGTTVTSPPSYCATICNQVSLAGCGGSDPGSCVDGCTQIFTQYADCNAEIKGFYDCAVADMAVNGCQGSAEACIAEANALGTCINGGTLTCSTDGCSASGNNDCQCSGSCNGYSLEADCKGTSGAVECSCLVDGQYAGTCTDMELTCDLYGGCCSNYFPI